MKKLNLFKTLMVGVSCFTMASCSILDTNNETNSNPNTESKDNGETTIYRELEYLGIDEENSNVVNGVRNIVLKFNKIIALSSDIVDIQKTSAGNFIKLGRQFIGDISGVSIEAPKLTKNLIIHIPETYTISEKSLLKINDGCIIGDCKIPTLKVVYENGFFSDYKDLYIETLDSSEIIKKNGYSLSFSHRITLGQETKISDLNFECGMYAIFKTDYLTSGKSSLENYINDAKPINKIIYNSSLTKDVDGYYFKTAVKLNEQDYSKDIIPVGYVLLNEKLYLGQDGSFATSLINEAAKNKNDYLSLFINEAVFELTTSSASTIVKENNKYYLKFNSSLSISENFTLDLFNYSSGTYLIRKSSYEQSACSSLDEYLANNTPSDTTYFDIPTEPIKNENHYEIISKFEIKEADYEASFIPVAYFKTMDKTYLGQKGAYNTSLYSEAKTNIRNYPDLFLNHYSINVSTSGEYSISKANDIYSLNTSTTISINDDGNLNDVNYEYGAFIINKNHFSQTNSTSFSTYLSSYSESTGSKISTYKKVCISSYTEPLSKNGNVTYSFPSSFAISSDDYEKELIIVGYIKFDETYIFGQSASSPVALSLHGLATKTPLLYPDLCKEYFTVSLSSTKKTYELINNTFNESLISFNYDKNGYYKIVANENVNEFYLNGKKLANKTITKGETTYISVAKGEPKFISSSHGVYKGFAEPNKEAWNDPNGNFYLNTYKNNAIIFSQMNGECARIWLSAPALYWGPGQGHPIYTESGFRTDFNAQAVKYVQDAIAAYRQVGIKEIILLINGMYYTNDDYIFFHNYGGDRGIECMDQHRAAAEFTINGVADVELATTYPMKQVFPIEGYDSFIENNKKFYQLLANTFDCDYFECLNEINLNPFQHDTLHNLKSYEPAYNPNGGNIVNVPIEDQGEVFDRVAKSVADYCKAMSDGVALSSRKNIRILTPAIASVNDSPRNDQWAKPQIRDDNRFFTKMYDYIVNEKSDEVQNYFQGLNIHPYMFLSFDTGYNENYLFWSKSPEKYPKFEDRLNGSSTISEKNFNSNVVSDWLNDLNGIHKISKDYNDDYCPIFSTEFGFTDYYGMTSAWTNFSNAHYLPDIINEFFPAIKDLDYLAGIYWFRLYSFDHVLRNGTVTDGGEANFGFITKEKGLKNWGKTLYTQYTGKNDYSTLLSVISNLEDDNNPYTLLE